MAESNEYIFPATGTKVLYEPEHHLLVVLFAKTVDVSEIITESGWLLPLVEEIMTKAGEPTSILTSTENLSPREKVPFDTFMRFIKVLHHPHFKKFAFYGEKKFVHALAGEIRILSLRPVQAFETEAEARAWLAE